MNREQKVEVSDTTKLNSYSSVRTKQKNKTETIKL